jgi:hypothetical protein
MRFIKMYPAGINQRENAEFWPENRNSIKKRNFMEQKRAVTSLNILKLF